MASVATLTVGDQMKISRRGFLKGTAVATTLPVIAALSAFKETITPKSSWPYTMDANIYLAQGCTYYEGIYGYRVWDRVLSNADILSFMKDPLLMYRLYDGPTFHFPSIDKD